MHHLTKCHYLTFAELCTQLQTLRKDNLFPALEIQTAQIFPVLINTDLKTCKHCFEKQLWIATDAIFQTTIAKVKQLKIAISI